MTFWIQGHIDWGERKGVLSAMLRKAAEVENKSKMEV
jgi:hypothetical protein